jgi:glycosyltransferase involved in cell wall biosynthesis
MKPNILFFIVSFFPRARGATYSAFTLARELRSAGLSIRWIVHDEGSWRNGGEYDGFPVRSFRVASNGKRGKAAGLIRFTFHIVRSASTFDVFHVHGGGHMNILIAGWVKLLLPRKKVMLKCTMDGWDTPDGVRQLKYGRLLLWIYRNLDGVVAMTSGQHEKLETYRCKGHTAVIPNATDCSRFRPDAAEGKKTRRELGIPPDAVVLCYAGAIGHRKGIDVLLATWHRLQQQYGQVYLLTVGDFRLDYDADAEMCSLLEEAGLPPDLLKHPNLRRLGRVDDLERYLQAADLFIFPSRQEGFGTVQTEAMACALPCLVNDLPGVSSDIYPDESVGFRIAGNDVDEFVRIASELIENPEKRENIGAAARRRVIDHFSTESVGRRYADFYEKMLGRT